MIQTVEEISHIHDNLYLGSHPRYDAPLREFGKIMCFDGRPSYQIYEGQSVVCIPFKDDAYTPNETMLYEAAELAWNWAQTSKVLLHCSGGINRSSLVTGLTLVKHYGMTPDEAISLIREKRSSVCLMNKHFEEWLRKQ